MTDFQKQVKAACETNGPAEIYADKLVMKRSGAVEVKRGYFYHLDWTADLWARRVQACMAAAGVACTVTSRDDFRNWPGQSYLVAVVAPTGGAA